MNQEQNNFNTQANNGIPNNQPLNNQSFNQQSINPQPQPTPSYGQPIMQESTQQMGNMSKNYNYNNGQLKKGKNKLWVILAIAVVLIIIAVIYFCVKSDNTNQKQVNNEVYAKFYFVPLEENGRHSEFWDGYKSVASINNSINQPVTVKIMERKQYNDDIYFLLKLTSSEKLDFKNNDSINIYEGGSLVAIGEIVPETYKITEDDTYLHKSCSIQTSKTKIKIKANAYDTLIENMVRVIIIDNKYYYGAISFDDGMTMTLREDNIDIYINLCQDVNITTGETIKIIYNGKIITEGIAY